MIDEKGRLFGKINIVDLLVLLVIVIAAAVLGFKFLGSDGSVTSSSKTTHVTYTVLVESVRPEVYENILEYIPSTLMASGEYLDGQVVAVEAAPHDNTATLSTEGDLLLINTDKGLLDLTFTIECNVVNTVTTEIGTQEVRVGKSHIVKTDKFELSNGVVTSCVWDDGEE